MQGSFLDVEFAHKRKQTRRETFLAEMEALIPWDALEAELVAYYPQGRKGRRPYPLAVMLRVHCLQHFYNLSDAGLEDALYEIASMRRFARISRLADIPDETTILHFRHFLTNFSLSETLFERINAVLAERGCKMSSGTIVDATILHAPSSTKNKQKARDPEMHQTKKGNQWYFGMKLHVGVDRETGLTHSAKGTAANTADVTQAEELLRPTDTDAHGDAGYAGAGKRQLEANRTRPKEKQRETRWRIAMRRGKRKLLSPGCEAEKQEQEKASIRARVEHVFRWVKGVFGYSKLRYRGLKKNMDRLYLLLGMANLLRARSVLAG
jgi:IS5 family transposase